MTDYTAINKLPFIKKLVKEINFNNNICKNSSLFKEKCNLKLLCSSNFIKKGLFPLETMIGTFYMIKNNSIFEFRNGLGTYTQDPRYEEYEILYKSIVLFKNINIGDIGDFSNAESFLNMDKLVSYSVSKTLNFVTALYNLGFEIWIRDTDMVDNLIKKKKKKKKRKK